jgi:hypothetical protein
LVRIGHPHDVVHLGDIPGVKPAIINVTAAQLGADPDIFGDIPGAKSAIIHRKDTQLGDNPTVYLDGNGNAQLDPNEPKESISAEKPTCRFEVFPGFYTVRIDNLPVGNVLIYPPGIGLLATIPDEDGWITDLVELRTDPAEVLKIGGCTSIFECTLVLLMAVNPQDGLVYGIDFLDRLVRLDTNTGMPEWIGSIYIEGWVYIEYIIGFAFHPNGTLYIIGTPQGGQLALFTIDNVDYYTYTGLATQVGLVDPNMGAIEFDQKGTLYGALRDSNEICILNPNTAAVTAKIPVADISGVSSFGYEDLACSQDGHLYAAVDGNAVTDGNEVHDGSAVIKINLDTGSSTTVATYPEEIWGLTVHGQGCHRVNAESGEEYDYDFIWNKPPIVIEDFEDYNDIVVIGETWADGVEDSNNGSQVGHEESPFMEHEIVHRGRQSMPFYYNNTEGVTESSVKRMFDPPQDVIDYDSLSLCLYGDPNNNGGRLFIQVNETKVPVDIDLTIPEWQDVEIDLEIQNQHLEFLNKIGIGVDGADSTGRVYVDTIEIKTKEIEL